MAAQAEPLHDIAHLGSVELFTPKPEKSLWYFRDLLGMEPVHESGPSVYLRGYGDYATSTLKLTTASTNGVGCISWRATSAQALERRAKAIEAAGLGLGWSNGDFGRGRSYRFRDPDGHVRVDQNLLLLESRRNRDFDLSRHQAVHFDPLLQHGHADVTLFPDPDGAR